MTSYPKWRQTPKCSTPWIIEHLNGVLEWSHTHSPRIYTPTGRGWRIAILALRKNTSKNMEITPALVYGAIRHECLPYHQYIYTLHIPHIISVPTSAHISNLITAMWIDVQWVSIRKNNINRLYSVQCTKRKFQFFLHECTNESELDLDTLKKKGILLFQPAVQILSIIFLFLEASKWSFAFILFVYITKIPFDNGGPFKRTYLLYWIEASVDHWVRNPR